MPVSIRRAAETIGDLFEEHQWLYEYNTEKRRFTARFDLHVAGLDHLELHVHARPNHMDPSRCRAIISYGLIPLKADPAHISQVCEYLTRANFGLGIGNFELDFPTGTIRYKVTINCRSGLPGFTVLSDLISVPVAMFNRYGAGLVAVNAGTETAEEAAKKADA